MSRRRGAPLAALVLIAGSWIMLRVVGPGHGLLLPPGVSMPPAVFAEADFASGGATDALPLASARDDGAGEADQAARTQGEGRAFGISPRPPLSIVYGMVEEHPESRVPRPPVTAQAQPVALRSPYLLQPEAERGHLPSRIVEAATLPPGATRAGADNFVGENGAQGAARWSADGWLLLRKGGGAAAAIGAASYGASQAGAVVRYALSPQSRHRPRAHARATTAVEGPQQDEIAIGVGIRPLPVVPVEVLVEGRVGRFGEETRIRPAIVAVASPPPVTLAIGFEAESYAQAGYVGGHDATAFVDGQARATREIMRSGDISLRAGAGVWGGAQRGASRLDAGPAITATTPVRPGFARISLDWRQRVAGGAMPGSGPVFTISAGF